MVYAWSCDRAPTDSGHSLVFCDVPSFGYRRSDISAIGEEVLPSTGIKRACVVVVVKLAALLCEVCQSLISCEQIAQAAEGGFRRTALFAQAICRIVVLDVWERRRPIEVMMMVVMVVMGLVMMKMVGYGVVRWVQY